MPTGRSVGRNVTKVAQLDVLSVRSERRSLSSVELLDLDLPTVMVRLISYEREGCDRPVTMKGILTEVFFLSPDLFTFALFTPVMAFVLFEQTGFDGIPFFLPPLFLEGVWGVFNGGWNGSPVTSPWNGVRTARVGAIL